MLVNDQVEQFLTFLIHFGLNKEREQTFAEFIAADKAQVLESVPVEYRIPLWQKIPADELWDVLSCLQTNTAQNIIRSLDENARLEIQNRADASKLAANAQLLPKSMLDNIILELDQNDNLQSALSYADDQVGRYLHRNFLRVRVGISVASVIRRLIKKDSVTAVFLVNDERELMGYIPIIALFNNPEDTLVEALARPVQGVTSDQNIYEAARVLHFEEDMTYVPVLSNGKVTGALSVPMLLNMVQTRLAQVPTDKPGADEDLFSPPMKAVIPRGFWLCINLMTAFLASWVIGIFEAVLQQVVALAILMPVVASMGGIAGSQTLAVTVRGLGLGHLHSMNIRLLFSKEMKVAVVNGLLIGLLIAAVVSWWFGSFWLGSIIWLAVVVNSLAAAASGTYIPFILQKLDIDPAVASAVILTTVTDVIGFFIFLGAASLVFLQ